MKTSSTHASLGTGFFGVRLSVWYMLLTIGLLGLPLTARATEVQSGAVSATDYLPDAALVDQAGKPVSFAALKGKPVLVGFVHTSCRGVCEMLTTKMKSIAADLDPSFSKKVTMVSVTTDPAEDDPKALAAYAQKQGAVGPGWVFLTGQRDQVVKILKVYNVPEGEPGDELTHVMKLYLIGPDGRELHQYNSMKVAATAVAADVRSAIARR
jgi:protein SCO1